MYGDGHKRVPEKSATVRRAFVGDNNGFHYLIDETVEIGGLALYGAEWRSDFRGDPMHYHFERDIPDVWLMTGCP